MNALTTAVEGHADSEVLAGSSPAPRLGLTPWDQKAITAFVKGDSQALADFVEDARLLAEGLAGDDGDSSRARMAARAVASGRAQQRVLEALLADRLAARDEAGVALVSKVLDGVTRRLSVWMKHLQVEAALRRRPVVLINHAEKVNVG